MSDFEVRIKQSQSGESVKDTLNDLKTIKSAATDSTKAAGEGFESMGRKVNATQNIAAGFARALKGDLTGLVQVGQGLRGMFAGLGASVAVVSAALAGWKIGERVREFLWMKLVTSQVGEEFEGVGNKARRARAEVAGLAQEKLTALKQQIEDTVKKLEELSGFQDNETLRKEEVFQAQHERERAKIQATMPAGPARDRALAKEDAEYAGAKADRTIQASTKTIATANEQKATIDNQIVAAQQEYDAAKTDKTVTGPTREIAAKKKLDELTGMRPAIAKKANAAIYDAESQRTVASLSKDTSSFTEATAVSSANAQEAEQAQKEAQAAEPKGETGSQALRAARAELAKITNEAQVLKQQLKYANRRR